MSVPRPPSTAPSLETLDDADIIDDNDIDETAPPQRSPLAGALPFGGVPGKAPVFPPAPAAPQASSNRPPAPPPPRGAYGEETAAPERSPLAAALPFRHARPPASAATVALPMPTPEDLRRLAAGGFDPSAAMAKPAGAAAPIDKARLERARIEQARTVAFATPPGPEDYAPTEALPAMGQPSRAPAQGHQAPAQGHQAPAQGHQAPAQGHQAPAQAHQSAAQPPRASAQAHQGGAQAHQGGASPQQAPAGVNPVPEGGGPVAAKSTGHFGLSIEQYAALCAEIGTFPERADAIFAQYGLASRKDRMTADLAWQDRLRADNALMTRWQGLYLYYHEYYLRMKQH